MKRKAEFEAYLHKNGKNKAYVGYCEKIEEAFGGKDMDEIIASHQNVAKVRTKLMEITSSAHSVDDYMSGLNRYLEFSVSAKVPAVVGAITASIPSHYCIARAEGVELTADVERVSWILDREYDRIIAFVRMLLAGSNLQYMPLNHIPVIISDEKPMRESPDGLEPILGRFFGAAKPYIEIYYRNEDVYNAAAFRNCLAHEYMHYVHYVYAGAAFSDASEELREALADFFSVLYSVYRHGKDDIAIAKKCHKNWKKRFGTWWPYAAALHFYRVCGVEMKFSSEYNEYVAHGSIEKFIRVLAETILPKNAYDLLIHT